MPKLRLTGPNGEVKTISVSEVPNEQQMNEIIGKVFDTSQAQPTQQVQPATTSGTPQIQQPVDEFTRTEKIVAGSVPVVSGIAGSLKGAAVGASLGSAFPVVGTAIGGIAGAAIGGAITSAGGRFLADSLEDYFGGEERTSEEKLKRAGKEALFSAGADILLPVVGKAVKGTVLKGARHLGKEVKTLKGLQRMSRKIGLAKKNVSNKMKEINIDIGKAKTALNDAVVKEKQSAAIGIAKKGVEQKAKAEFTEASLNKALSKTATIIDSESSSVAKKMATASNKALKSLGLEYDKVERAFGSKFTKLSDVVGEVDQLAKSNDPLIFQSMAPVKKVADVLSGKRKFIVKDAIALRRSLSGTIRKLYSRGGEASGALADNLSAILTKVDDKLDIATSGATTALNSNYKNTINLAKANSLFKDDLLRAGNAGIKNAEDIIKTDLKSFKSAAETAGKDFFRVDPKEAKVAIEAGESIFNIGQKQILKLTNQSNVLRQTGLKPMVELADSIDASLVKIAKGSVNRGLIKKNLKNIGIPDGLSTELSKEIEERLLKDSPLAGLTAKKLKLQERAAKLSVKDLKTETKLSELTGVKDVYRDLLGLYIGANTAGGVLTSVGLKKIGVPILAAANLVSLARISPSVANSIEPMIAKFVQSALSGPSGKKEIVKQLLQDITFQLDEAKKSE